MPCEKRRKAIGKTILEHHKSRAICSALFDRYHVVRAVEKDLVADRSAVGRQSVKPCERFAVPTLT